MTGEEWLTSGVLPPVHLVLPPEDDPPAISESDDDPPGLDDSDDEESILPRVALECAGDGDDGQPYDFPREGVDEGQSQEKLRHRSSLATFRPSR